MSSFCNLSDQELQSLNTYKSAHKYKKGQILFSEGELTRGLHCVHEGKIKLYKTLSDGTVQILRIAKGADLIGYRGLLGDGRYIATAETLEPSTVCFIPKESILDLIRSNVQFTMDLFSKVAHDISEAENRTITFARKSSRERLAGILLYLQQTFGVSPEGYINVLLTREEMGNLSGMATETVVRILHEFQELGVIQLNRKYIQILDKEALLEISDVEE